MGIIDTNIEKDIVLETLIEHESKIKNVKKKVKRYKEETTDDVNVLNDKIKGVAKDLKNIELTPGDKGKQGDKGDQGERGEDGLNGSKGNDGKQGDCGVKGDKGEQGKDGEEGMDGLDGDIGKDGKMPKHEWNHTSLRFEKKPDIWGKWVDLKGERGTGGMRGSGIDITDVKPLLP